MRTNNPLKLRSNSIVKYQENRAKHQYEQQNVIEVEAHMKPVRAKQIKQAADG